MRKKRVKAIREQELQNPQGISTASFRAAKRNHSRGHNRVPQPKPIASVGHPGFPTNNVTTIRTWREKVKVDRIIATEVGGKGKERKRVPIRVFYKYKNVTRVISRPKKREHEKG